MRSPVSRLLVSNVAAGAGIALLLMSSVAFGADAGGWSLDTAQGCKLWNPNPQPNETVRWSGACANGFAQGRGAAQWFRGNLPFESDEGEWREGRQTGFGSQVWPSGRYDGQIVDGMPNGRGTLIFRGVRYEGEVRDGKPDGIGTLTNAAGTVRGFWKDGCLQEKQKVAFGVPLSAC